MVHHCRVFHFDYKLVNGEAARTMARLAREIMEQQPGFRGVTFFADYENGHGGAMSLLDLAEAIENYFSEPSGLMRDVTAGLFIGAPKSFVAEVLEVD